MNTTTPHTEYHFYLLLSQFLRLVPPASPYLVSNAPSVLYYSEIVSLLSHFYLSGCWMSKGRGGLPMYLSTKVVTREVIFKLTLFSYT